MHDFAGSLADEMAGDWGGLSDTVWTATQLLATRPMLEGESVVDAIARESQSIVASGQAAELALFARETFSTVGAQEHLASLTQIVTALEGWQASWANTPVGSQWNVLGQMADLTTSLKDMGLDFRDQQWGLEARLISTMKTALATAPAEARGNSVEYEGFVAGLEGFANELRWRNLDATGLLFAGMLVANPDLVETSQNTSAKDRGADRRGLLEIMARTADRMDNHLAWAIKDAERLESLGIPNTVNQVILSALPVLGGALSVARSTEDLRGESTDAGLFGLGQKAAVVLAAALEEKGFSEDVARQLREMRENPSALNAGVFAPLAELSVNLVPSLGDQGRRFAERASMNDLASLASARLAGPAAFATRLEAVLTTGGRATVFTNRFKSLTATVSETVRIFRSHKTMIEKGQELMKEASSSVGILSGVLLGSPTTLVLSLAAPTVAQARDIYRSVRWSNDRSAIAEWAKLEAQSSVWSLKQLNDAATVAGVNAELMVRLAAISRGRDASAALAVFNAATPADREITTISAALAGQSKDLATPPVESPVIEAAEDGTTDVQEPGMDLTRLTAVELHDRLVDLRDNLKQVLKTPGVKIGPLVKQINDVSGEITRRIEELERRQSEKSLDAKSLEAVRTKAGELILANAELLEEAGASLWDLETHGATAQAMARMDELLGSMSAETLRAIDSTMSVGPETGADVRAGREDVNVDRPEAGVPPTTEPRVEPVVGPGARATLSEAGQLWMGVGSLGLGGGAVVGMALAGLTVWAAPLAAAGLMSSAYFLGQWGRERSLDRDQGAGVTAWVEGGQVRVAWERFAGLMGSNWMGWLNPIGAWNRDVMALGVIRHELAHRDLGAGEFGAAMAQVMPTFVSFAYGTVRAVTNVAAGRAWNDGLASLTGGLAEGMLAEIRGTKEPTGVLTLKGTTPVEAKRGLWGRLMAALGLGAAAGAASAAETAVTAARAVESVELGQHGVALVTGRTVTAAPTDPTPAGGVQVASAALEQPGVTPVHAHNVVISAMPEKIVISITDAISNLRLNRAVGTMEDPTYHLITGQGNSPIVAYRVTAGGTIEQGVVTAAGVTTVATETVGEAVTRAIQTGEKIDGTLTVEGKTESVAVSVANALGLAAVLPDGATWDDLGLSLEELMKRINQVESAVRVAKETAGARLSLRQDLRVRGLAFMHVLAPELKALDPMLTELLVDARLSSLMAELGLETNAEGLRKSLKQRIAELGGIRMSPKTYKALGVETPSKPLTDKALNGVAERMLGMMLTSEAKSGVPALTRAPVVRVNRYDAAGYAKAYKKATKASAETAPKAFVSQEGAVFTVHMAGMPLEETVLALAHEVAHVPTLARRAGVVGAGTSELLVEYRIQTALPRELGQLSLLGFLREVEALRGEKGVEAARLWLGYQLMAALAERLIGVKDAGARAYWMERLYSGAALKDLMAAPAVNRQDARVAVVAASELMNGKRVNTGVLGKFQALARDWAATEGGSPLRLVVVDNHEKGMPRALKQALGTTTLKGGAPVFEVLDRKSAKDVLAFKGGVASIDYKGLTAVLPGFLGTTTLGVRVVTGEKGLWKNVLKGALIEIGSAVDAIKKVLKDMRAVAKSA